MRASSPSPTATSSPGSASSSGTRGIMTLRARLGGVAPGALDAAQARGAPAVLREHELPADGEPPPHRPARRAVLRDQLVCDRRDGAVPGDLDVARGAGQGRRVAVAPAFEVAERGPD